MDNKSMDNLSANGHVNHNTNHQLPLTIYSNLSRSTDIQYCYERPMMLNTWTQTSNAELGISDDYLQKNMYIEQCKQREKALLQEIHKLQTELNKRDMLAQSSSVRSNSSHFQKTPGAREVIVNQIPVQLHANHPHLMDRQHQQQYTTTQFQVHNTQISPRSIHCQKLSQKQKSPQQRPALQLLDQNNIQTQYMTEDVVIQHQDGHTITNTIPSGRPRKVNYKIIADGSVNGHDGPIEIEIAEEENTLNLNGSANSERLEICFSEEQPQSATNVNYVRFDNDTQQNISNEIPEQNSGTPGPSKKRFKKSTENVSKHPDQNNCESPESIRNVSHHSNTRTSPGSSQCPGTEIGCKMLEPQQPMAANNNQSNIRANGVEINNQHQERAVLELRNSYTSIGPNNTRIPTEIFDSISWDNASMATRKLMMTLFSRETLATHSMTGKPSPAFKDHNKPVKKMLNPVITQDIVFAVSRRCKVKPKEVRSSITTKCADENKMWKISKAKALLNKENKKPNRMHK